MIRSVMRADVAAGQEDPGVSGSGKKYYYVHAGVTIPQGVYTHRAISRAVRAAAPPARRARGRARREEV